MLSRFVIHKEFLFAELAMYHPLSKRILWSRGVQEVGPAKARQTQAKSHPVTGLVESMLSKETMSRTFGVFTA